MLRLRREWAQDVCFRQRGCSDAHIAAAASCVGNSLPHCDKVDIYTGAARVLYARTSCDAYRIHAERVEARSSYYHGAPDQGPTAAYAEAASCVMLGYTVGCIARGEFSVLDARVSLNYMDSDEALYATLDKVTRLQRDCEVWQSHHSVRKREEPHSSQASERDAHAPYDAIPEEKEDNNRPRTASARPSSHEPAASRWLWMMGCGAIACGLGVALPMLWGMVVPWAFVLLGAIAGGLLGCKDACSQRSVGQVAWMLMGWMVLGFLGMTVGGVSWGMLSLVASHGLALAVGMGTAALCVGGFGLGWSQVVPVAQGATVRTMPHG